METGAGKLGHFDQSFAVRTIISFTVSLLLLALEVGLRFVLVVYRFYQDGEHETRVASESLAADLKAIMLNRGGPVASRTVYPILARNFERAGLHIAIEPSPVTVTSIEKRFGFGARGLPPIWPEGQHNAATVALRAEEFCLQCHPDHHPDDPGGMGFSDFSSKRPPRTKSRRSRRTLVVHDRGR